MLVCVRWVLEVWLWLWVVGAGGALQTNGDLCVI